MIRCILAGGGASAEFCCGIPAVGSAFGVGCAVVVFPGGAGVDIRAAPNIKGALVFVADTVALLTLGSNTGTGRVKHGAGRLA